VATIAVMTDFGLKDGNVGVMKGVIWRICPEARIADVSHLIGPQNLAEAALVLARSAPYFPDGTIHLVVVDPGVGTDRRPLAARLGGGYYVGPDNGVITLWLERALGEGYPCEFVALDRPEFWLSEVSHVFHGRDIFAPAAAHLAAGVPLLKLGTPFSDPVQLHLPKPTKGTDGWRGEVIHIDHFGNLSTNIRREQLADALGHKNRLVVRLGNTRIEGLVDAFGEREAGAIIALLGSTGNLIVSVVNGDAAFRLGARVGDPIEVQIRPLGSTAKSGAPP
jgi:S-adenosylmethionine hydrolase